MANKRRGRGRRRQTARRTGQQVQYGVQFTDKGRAALAEVFAQFRDRPLYYLLGEDGEPTPLGTSHLLGAEEKDRWRAFLDDAAARTLQETRIDNPEHPHYPVFVHTAFTAQDISFAFPLPDGTPALWQTTLLEESMADMEAAAKRAEAEPDDGSWLLKGAPDVLPEEVSLAGKLGLSVDDLGEWVRVYGTRDQALEGHEETVRWIRRALGSF